MDVQAFTELLQEVAPNGSGWVARCPAHDDDRASLSIHEGDGGRTLLKCFAGCSFEAITAAVNVRPADLMGGPNGSRRERQTRERIDLEALARDKGLPLDFLRGLGCRDLPGGRVRIPYHDPEGREVVDRLRYALKAGDGSRWPKGAKPIPYGLDRLAQAREKGSVVLVEGESDAWTLWHHGIPALGLPGADMAKTLDASHLEGLRRLFIVQEPDKGGETFVRGVAGRLRVLEWSGELRVIRMADHGHKDPNDWHRADSEGFSAAFRLAAAAAEPAGLEELGGQESGAQADDADEAIEIVQGIAESVLDLADLLRLEIPERRRWLPWLPEGGIVMTYGTRGIGKTYFNQSLTCALTTATPFLSWKVPEPCGVLYVDGEMSLNDLRKRFVALLPKPHEAPLRLLSAEMVYHKTQRDLRLTDPRMREAVSAVLAKAPEIKVLVLDNVSCLFTGLDEDSKRDWEVVLPWLLRLRHRGISVVLVHHAGKGGDQRGTSGREDLLDTVIRLEKPHDWKAEEGARFVLRFTKSRGVTGTDVADLEAAHIDGPEGLSWTYKSPEEGTQQRMLRLIADGIDRQTELPEELGVTKGTVSKVKRKLIKLGYIKEVNALLILTAEGRKVLDG